MNENCRLAIEKYNKIAEKYDLFKIYSISGFDLATEKNEKKIKSFLYLLHKAYILINKEEESINKSKKEQDQINFSKNKKQKEMEKEQKKENEEDKKKCLIEKILFKWGNKIIKNEESEKYIVFDKNINYSLYFVDILEYIEPRIINRNFVNFINNKKDEMKLSKYIISIIRKLGSTLYIDPEKIKNRDYNSLVN